MFDIKGYKREKRAEKIKKIVRFVLQGLGIVAGVFAIWFFTYAYLIISHAVFNAQ